MRGLADGGREDFGAQILPALTMWQDAHAKLYWPMRVKYSLFPSSYFASAPCPPPVCRRACRSDSVRAYAVTVPIVALSLNLYSASPFSRRQRLMSIFEGDDLVAAWIVVGIVARGVATPVGKTTRKGLAFLNGVSHRILPLSMSP